MLSFRYQNAPAQAAANKARIKAFSEKNEKEKIVKISDSVRDVSSNSFDPDDMRVKLSERFNLINQKNRNNHSPSFGSSMH